MTGRSQKVMKIKVSGFSDSFRLELTRELAKNPKIHNLSSVNKEISIETINVPAIVLESIIQNAVDAVIFGSKQIEDINYKFSGKEKFGVYLLELLATPASRDAIIGDLLEAREDIREKHGERKARLYFWWQVTRTIFPFVWSAIKRWKWVAAIFAAFGWVARQFSS